MHACTIIARNYLPYARVLAESFSEHHPDAQFTALILDGVEDLDEPFETVSPYEIGIERDELHRMAMIYDLKEFATAVKPWLLRTLLDRGADAAVYFDPDIAIYAPLDDVGALAQEHSIVLTPHTTEPLPDDGCLPDYSMIMHAGIYNLGFIAVGDGAREFLDWWSDRLARRCIVALDQALFVDQRWIDFVPALFGHYILRDPGCNVAYWNLHERSVRRNGECFEVNGEPLRFFHFSGYKPNTPHVLSHHAGAHPRIFLSQRPDLAALCERYGRRVLEQGYGRDQGAPYRYDRTPGGIAIDSRMRRLFRDELLEIERTGGKLPLDPFDEGETSKFLDWLREPAGRGRKGAVSRYAYALYLERPDLQRAFPNVLGADAPRYLDWMRMQGQPQLGFPAELLEGGPRRATVVSAGRGALTRLVVRVEKRLRSFAHSHPRLARAKPVWWAAKRARVVPGRRAEGFTAGNSGIEVAEEPAAGVNLVGYLNAELGIGEVARKLMSGLERAGIAFSTITYDRTLNRQEHPLEGRRPQQAPYDMNVICVNADQLPVFRDDAGPELFDQRHTVGVWFWEVSRFPPVMQNAFGLVDEIWAATEFVRDALAATTAKPVHIVPIPLEMPSAEPIERKRLGLPDRFMFLFSFDFLSIFERKNPLGVVDAFVRAFAEGDGPILVLKCINGEHDLESLERLRLATAARGDIYLLEDYLAPEEKNALMAGCDCYVSLHRSEGLGLTIAEAMAYGKPVIATNYSGNVDFMNEGNSHPIPYELVPIQKGCGPYPVGAEWADPDIDAAAEAMRRVVDDPAAALALGERARADVLERFSVDRTAAFLAERFESRVPWLGGGEPGEPARSSEEALAAVYRRLKAGPGDRFIRAKHRRFGARSARSVLRRLLWPYIAGEYELQTMVAEAISRLCKETQQLEGGVAEVRGATEQLESRLGHLESRLGHLESRLGHLDARLGHLDARLGHLDAELTATPYLSDPESVQSRDDAGRPVIGYRGAARDVEAKYREFEDVFRGTEEFIQERQRPYLDLLGSLAPVLDVGCGRGEFLELLAQTGIEGRGIDSDAGMVARCREKGLAVERAEVIPYLEELQDGSLGALFSAQLIEHLPYEELVRYFELGARKLAAGGLLIAETVNPHSIRAFKAFWVDPSHRAPIFPEVAVTLARLHGLESAYAFFPLGVGELERDRLTQGEYALVARRAG